MNLSRTLGLIVAFGLVVGLTYVARPGAADSSPPIVAAPAGSLTELDRLIEVFEDRAPQRGESLEYRKLGDLYTERGDATSHLADYRNALNAYRGAVEIDSESVTSRLSLAGALLTLHEFSAAERIATELVAQAPEDVAVIALAGDTALEVGDYALASQRFAELDDIVLATSLTPDPAVTVRLANLAYFTGDPKEARRLAELAVRQSETLRSADRAFYEALAGSIAFLTGDLAGAEQHHEIAVALTPTDQGALGELSRVRAALGDFESAIDLLERANAIFPEPDHLTRLADLYAVTGTANEETIEELYQQGQALATLDGDHERAWARARAQFLLDHGREVEVALSIMEIEMLERRDVTGLDLYAWALFHNGDLAGARTASDQALAVGTQSAIFWYHAGVISAAMGETGRAITELERSQAINGAFEPVHAARAAALLDELRRA